jgi:hypothetical protein
MRKIYFYIFCLVLSISATQLKAQNCWSPLGSGTPSYTAALTTYNGNLIAGGYFNNVGGSNIASWNGSTWTALGSGMSVNTANSNPYAVVLSVIEYNGELYAAGQFDTANGVPVNNIAKWDGTSWSNVGSGLLALHMMPPKIRTGS